MLICGVEITVCLTNKHDRWMPTHPQAHADFRESNKNSDAIHKSVYDVQPTSKIVTKVAVRSTVSSSVCHDNGMRGWWRGIHPPPLFR